MKTWLLVGVSIMTASTAWAGKPKWCSRDIPQEPPDNIKSADVEENLMFVAYALCTDPDVDIGMPRSAVDEAYKKLSARLALSEDDWKDVAAWAIAGGDRSGRPSLNGDARKKPWSQLDPIEQFAGLGDNWISGGNVDKAYFVDALGPKLSESARAGYIADCLKPGLHPTDQAVAWAMCQPDIDAFDPKKVFAEMHADTSHDGTDRIYLRLVADDLAHELPAHAAEVKKLLAKDPIFGQMFDIAKQQRTSWKPSSDVLALQVAMEDAAVSGSRRASEGCGDKTWKAVLGSVSKIPAKTFQLHRKEQDVTATYLWSMRDVVASALLSEPDPFLAVNAHAMCRDTTKTAQQDALMGMIYRIGPRWAGYRGPRTAAQTQIFMANLQPDDRDTSIVYPEVSHSRSWFGDHNGAGSGVGGYGTVTKVGAKGGKVHLEFQKHKHTTWEAYGCKKTSRIQAIRDSGEIVYEENCAGARAVVTMEGQDPLDLDAETAKAVKVGMVLDIENGMVLVAWPNEKTDLPALVFGQPVK